MRIGLLQGVVHSDTLHKDRYHPFGHREKSRRTAHMMDAALALSNPSGICVMCSTFATAYSPKVPSSVMPASLRFGQSLKRDVRQGIEL